MNKFAISFLLMAIVAYSAGCQTVPQARRQEKINIPEKEQTIFLCVNTQPPDDHTSMINFDNYELITDFTYLPSGEIVFGTLAFDGIFHSKDGGKTFEKVKTPNVETISAFSFIDSQNGVLIDRASNFSLWRTQNAGISWDKKDSFKSFAGKLVPPQEIKFTSLKNGVFLAGDKDIYETFDGGNNWKEIKIPSFADRIIYYPLNDDNAWIAFGKNSKTMYVLKKEVGNWKTYQIQNAADFSDPDSIFFLDANSGWITTDMGEIFSTRDSGKNWEKINFNSNKIFIKSIFWSDSQNGWLAGSDRENQAVLLKTTDGGKSWNISQTENERFFSKIYFINQSLGWLISREKIYSTNDGGETWVPVVKVSLLCH